MNIKDHLVGMAYDEGNLINLYSLDDEASGIGIWSKMYSIGPVCLGSGCWPSHCFKNGGEVLIRKQRRPFSLYDPETKETKEFDSTVNAIRIRMYYSYTPSLICVPGMESWKNYLSTQDGFETYSFVKSDLPSFTRD